MKFDLKTRDLVNVGIFTVVYFLVLLLTPIFAIFGPIGLLVGGAVGKLLGGIVIMFYLGRVPKLGAMTLLSLFIGAFMTFTGHAWVTWPLILVLGFVADLMVSSTRVDGRPNRLAAIFAYGIFSMWSAGPLLPILYASDAYFARIAARRGGAELAQRYQQIFTPQFVIIWIIALFVIGLVGGWIGTRIAAKHFRRAGLTK